MKKILVIEDDDFINGMLCDLLIQNEYNPTAAFSGTEGILCFNNYEFDLVLLDLMLPGKVGNDVIAEIREKSNVPIIALTAIIDKESIVKILKSGANDYITKPFDNDELLARIEVVLRRTHRNKNILNYKDIVVDIDKHIVKINDIVVNLTPKEFEILVFFIQHVDIAITRERLLAAVWGYEFVGESRTIDIHVQHVRRKMNLNHHLITIPKLGYRLES